MSDRSSMDAALRSLVVPGLRAQGFSGSFPHLRRETPRGFDLLTFQFNKHGGSFTVEIARCKPEGVDHPSLGHIPAKKAKAWDRHPNYRKRIGECQGGKVDEWFAFATCHSQSVAEATLTRLSDPSIWDNITADGDEAPYRKTG